MVSLTYPTHPDTVGHYWWLHGAAGIAADADYAYVASDSGLAVYQFYGADVEETKNTEPQTKKGDPTVVRGVLELGADRKQNAVCRAELLDISGRKVIDLHPGANGVSILAPGVYFVRERSAVSGERPAVNIRKVIITR